MKVPIELAAIAEDIWNIILERTENEDHRIFITGYLSGRSFSEGKRGKVVHPSEYEAT